MVKNIIARGPEIPGWPDKAPSPWRHVICMRNQIIRKLFGNYGSKPRQRTEYGSNASCHQLCWHASVRVSREETSCRVDWHSRWTDQVLHWLVPDATWMGPTVLAARSSLSPMFLGSIYFFSNSLCFEKMKTCRAGSTVLWKFVSSPNSYVES